MSSLFVSSRCRHSVDLLDQMEKCEFTKNMEIIDIDEFEPHSFPKFLTHIPTLVVSENFVVGYKNILDYMINLENVKQNDTSDEDEMMGLLGSMDTFETFATKDNFDTSSVGQHPDSDKQRNAPDEAYHEQSVSTDDYNRILEREITEREKTTRALTSGPRKQYENHKVSDNRQSHSSFRN